MADNNLSNLIGKVKSATKQAAEATVRQAKIARLRFDLMTAHSEKSKHLQNMGNHLFSLYKQKSVFDQTKIYSDLNNEIYSVEMLDKRLDDIEAQIQAQQLDGIEIKDITPQ